MFGVRVLFLCAINVHDTRVEDLFVRGEREEKNIVYVSNVYCTVAITSLCSYSKYKIL